MGLKGISSVQKLTLPDRNATHLLFLLQVSFHNVSEHKCDILKVTKGVTLHEFKHSVTTLSSHDTKEPFMNQDIWVY